MLDGHVHVFDNLLLPRHHVEQAVGDPVGIAVEDAHPPDPVDFAELLEQLGQCQPAVEVLAVPRGVLRHNVQFSHASRGKTFCFLHDLFHRAAAEIPADKRDGAVGTAVVAPVRHLEIGVKGFVGKDTLPFERQGVLLPEGDRPFARERVLDRPDNLRVAPDAEHHVRLGDLHRHLLAVPLGQASGHDDRLNLPRFLHLRKLEDRLDALPLRVLDEPAGVDDHHVARLRVGAKLVPALHDQREHQFRVHLVL